MLMNWDISLPFYGNLTNSGECGGIFTKLFFDLESRRRKEFVDMAAIKILASENTNVMILSLITYN